MINIKLGGKESLPQGEDKILDFFLVFKMTCIFIFELIKTYLMKIFLLLIFVPFSFFARAQEFNHQEKLDSILLEANLLYNYEKAVWNASDLLNDNKKLRKRNGGFVVYHQEDSIWVSFFNQDHESIIARYHFVNKDMEKPYSAQLEETKAKNIENNLLKIKNTIIDQLSDEEYNVSFPKNFNPNLILIPEKESYKLYIIMGTSNEGLVPFGNDYLFWADGKGKVIKWHKFHSKLIPARSEIPGIGTTVSSSHSHLRSTPYISATDICTFRLYAGYTELESFSVYSPAFKTTFVYDLKENRLRIQE